MKAVRRQRSFLFMFIVVLDLDYLDLPGHRLVLILFVVFHIAMSPFSCISVLPGPAVRSIVVHMHGFLVIACRFTRSSTSISVSVTICRSRRASSLVAVSVCESAGSAISSVSTVRDNLWLGLDRRGAIIFGVRYVSILASFDIFDLAVIIVVGLVLLRQRFSAMYRSIADTCELTSA